jgi:hypothetical protein
MNELIMSGPNEVLVRKDGSSGLAWFLLITTTQYCSRQAAMVGKEVVKMESWPGRRSSSNLRMVALSSDKADEDASLALKGASNMMHASMA